MPAGARPSLGHGVDGSQVTRRLTAANDEESGTRCVVVRTAGLLLGVRTGRLTLRDLGGRPVASCPVRRSRAGAPVPRAVRVPRVTRRPQCVC
jgi:hypothetical protein